VSEPSEPRAQATPPGTYREALAMRSRRALRCARCRYSVSVCLCDEIEPWPARTRVHVVAHYIELHKTTNTSRLAVRALEGATIHGRGHPEHRAPGPVPAGHRLVLYPSEHARLLTHADARDDLVLVVPDGTWTQAGRIARRDAAAIGAEHVKLPDRGPSRYALRSTDRPGAVSTIEAIAHALAILEGPAIEAHLLDVFDEFVRRALRRREGSVNDELSGASDDEG
jgi:DTW domain-containing protein YfiP